MPMKRRRGMERLRDLGERMQTLRNRAGLSQAQVSLKLGVPKSTFINWEGGRRYPDVLVLADFCRLVGADAGELLSGIPALTEEEGEVRPRGRPRKEVPAEPEPAKKPRGRPRKKD